MYLTFSNIRINLLKLIRNLLITFLIIASLVILVKHNLKIQQDYLQVKSANAQVQTFKDYMNLKNIAY